MVQRSWGMRLCVHGWTHAAGQPVIQRAVRELLILCTRGPEAALEVDVAPEARKRAVNKYDSMRAACAAGAKAFNVSLPLIKLIKPHSLRLRCHLLCFKLLRHA